MPFKIYDTSQYNIPQEKLGIQGPIGIQGSKGPTGPTGPIGPSGIIGPVGPQGSFGGYTDISILPSTGYLIDTPHTIEIDSPYFPGANPLIVKKGGVDLGSPMLPFANLFVGDLHVSERTIYVNGVPISSSNGTLILPSSTIINGAPIGSITILGTLPNPPTEPAELGNAYIVTNVSPSHMWIYGRSSENSTDLDWIDTGAIQGPKGNDGIKGDTGPTGPTGQAGVTTVIYENSSDIIYKDLTPGFSNINIGGTGPNRFDTIFAKSLNIAKYILYSDSYTLQNDIIIPSESYDDNFILDMDFSKNFSIDVDNYVFNGDDNTELLVNINIIYDWPNNTSGLAYRFLFNLYILRTGQTEKELIYGSIVGMDDYSGNIGLFSKKVKIKIHKHDRVYLNMKDAYYDLKIRKNSSMQIEIFT